MAISIGQSMTPLELAAILLIMLAMAFIGQLIILYIYHYYFLVPLFKLMSYQCGADLPPTFDSAFNSPITKRQPTKEPRKPLEGPALQEMMDKLNNAF